MPVAPALDDPPILKALRAIANRTACAALIAVASADGPIRAEQVHAETLSGLSYGAVYKALERLADAGIVARVGRRGSCVVPRYRVRHDYLGRLVEALSAVLPE